jgi:uncharacterized membrane protein
MNAEIAQYAAAVGAALADLPENVRDELTEDLPEHLAEVAAEAEAEGVGLTDKLGPPATYAAELRASLGHEEPQRRARWSDRRARLKTRLQPLNVRAGHILGYAQLTDLLRQLRPAWWVLRGYLAALLLAAILGGLNKGVIPEFGGNPVIGFLLIVGGIIGSVWLGRATTTGGKKTRIFSGVLSTGLALFAIAAVATVNGALTRGNYYGDPFEYTSQYQPSDVVVVDTKGHPIGPVGIVDLNSQTYLDTTVHTCEGMLPWERERWPLLQVLCRGTASPSPSPSASPSPSVLPSASPLPTPTR